MNVSGACKPRKPSLPDHVFPNIIPLNQQLGMHSNGARSTGEHSAIHIQRRSGDIGATITGQPADGAGDFLGAA